MTDSHSTSGPGTSGPSTSAAPALDPPQPPPAAEASTADPSGATPAPSGRTAQPRSGSFLGRMRTFQAVRQVPAFRWYLLSMSGNWSAMQMQNLARGFLTYEITGSFAALGTVELANTAPRLVFALTGGVVADRRSRRVITQIGQAISAVISAVLAALLFAGILRFEHLVIAAITQGIVNSFALPARQAMIPQIVGMDLLSNALALNVSLMSTLRLAAPAIAGFLLASIGASWVYALMAVLFLGATLTLFKVRLLPDGHPALTAAGEATPTASASASRAARRTGAGALADIKDALVYLWQIPVLRMLLVVDMFLGMLTFPYQRMLPGFVAEVLADSPEQTAVRMGLLLTVTGFGALFGSLLVASLPNRHRGKLVIGSVALFGLGLAAFSASEVFIVSLGIVLFMGIGQSGRQSLNSILIQSYTSNEFRGRVSSIMLFEDGIESLGIFAIALFASVVGPQVALGVTALTMLTLAASMWVLMPSYRRLQ